mmetsp:Transcript_163010/g.396062  ORF Transcript_163010/g.396062 Transcript_163010/m.396062 type:complete len:205 (-) Transcript_163010:16-630(-)
MGCTHVRAGGPAAGVCALFGLPPRLLPHHPHELRGRLHRGQLHEGRRRQPRGADAADDPHGALLRLRDPIRPDPPPLEADLLPLPDAVGHDHLRDDALPRVDVRGLRRFGAARGEALLRHRGRVLGGDYARAGGEAGRWRDGPHLRAVPTPLPGHEHPHDPQSSARRPRLRWTRLSALVSLKNPQVMSSLPDPSMMNIPDALLK